MKLENEIRIKVENEYENISDQMGSLDDQCDDVALNRSVDQQVESVDGAIMIEPNCEDRDYEDLNVTKVLKCEGVQNGVSSCKTDKIDISRGRKMTRNSSKLDYCNGLVGYSSKPKRMGLKKVSYCEDSEDEPTGDEYLTADKGSANARTMMQIKNIDHVNRNSCRSTRKTKVVQKNSNDTDCKTDELIPKCSESKKLMLDIKDEPVEVSIPSKTKACCKKKPTTSTKKAKKSTNPKSKIKEKSPKIQIKGPLTIEEVSELFLSKYSRSASRTFYRHYGTIVKSACKKYLIYRCRICANDFYGLDFAKEHFEKEHSSTSDERRIESCSKEKEDEDIFVEHFTQVYKCDQCELALPALYSFIKHRDSFHNGELRQYSCHKCSLITFDKYKFSMHVQSHVRPRKKIEKIECHLCHLSVCNIKRHLQEKHQNIGRIKCPQCPKIYETVRKAIHHQNSVHVAFGSNVTCKECGKTFKNGGRLREHLKTHYRTKHQHFECPFCKSKHHTKVGFKKHMSTHNSNGDFKPYSTYSCADCGRGFLREGLLLNHIRREHDPTCDGSEKKHLCETCGKSFESRFLFDRHMVVHTKEKKFVCATCNKGFTQIDSLKTHQVVHTGIKPFECGKCGNKYSQKYPLTQHIKKHHTD